MLLAIPPKLLISSFDTFPRAKLGVGSAQNNLKVSVHEPVVDEDRLVLDRVGNPACAEQRRLADFFKRQQGQMESDIRQFLVVKHALAARSKSRALAKQAWIGSLIWSMAILRTLPVIAREPTRPVGNTEAHHGPRSAIHRL